MSEVFRTPGHPRRGLSALVVHCSSSAYQDYFEEFLHRGLGLTTYALLCIPGGVHPLTLADSMPKYSWAGWRWLKFMVDVDHPARLILIGHEDCRWYQNMLWSQPMDQRTRQVEDLQRAAGAASERFPKLHVETYFARAENGQVVFETC